MIQRLTKPLVTVLELLLDADDDGCYGFEIIEQGKLGAGTVYPMLTRLEDSGWIESRWEEIDAAAAGRPARRYYKLTPTGRAEALTRLAARNGASGIGDLGAEDDLVSIFDVRLGPLENRIARPCEDDRGHGVDRNDEAGDSCQVHCVHRSNAHQHD